MAQYTVVIVEDNATSADIIARQMEAVGFQERHIVGTAQEGLALAQQLQPDLMVIDERLPDAILVLRHATTDLALTGESDFGRYHHAESRS